MRVKLVVWVAITTPDEFFTVTTTPYVPVQASGGTVRERVESRVFSPGSVIRSVPALDGNWLVTHVPGCLT